MNNPFACLALILAVCVVCYANSFSVPFIFDDTLFIVLNKSIHNLYDIKSIFFFNPSRFIGFLTLSANYALGGVQVFGYHLVNLTIHALASFAVFWLVSMLTKINGVKDYRQWAIPLFVALVFACHPVQTQAVTYIWQRVASLAALFYILSMALYLRSNMDAKGAKRTMFYVMSIVVAVLAMFTKQNTATLPIAIVLIDYFFFTSPHWKARLPRLAPFLLSLVIVPAMTWGFKTSELRDVEAADIKSLSSFDYFLTELNVIRTYIRLLFFPVGQNADYDYPHSHSIFELSVILSALLLMVIVSWGAYMYKKDRLASFGVFFFFVALAVESSFMPLKDVIFEHRLYLPMAGFAMTAGCVISKNRRRNTFLAITALICVPLCALTIARNRVWQNPITLWGDVVAKAPNNYRGHTSLGVAYGEKGMLDKAIQHYETARALNPAYVEARTDLGVAYFQTGKLDFAVSELAAALSIDPGYEFARVNLGAVYDSMGRTDEAIREYLTVLKKNPFNADAHSNLGVAYARQGNVEEAVNEFELSLKYNPSNSSVRFNLALSLAAVGKNDDAAEQFRRILQTDPANCEAAAGLGEIYQRTGRIADAEREFKNALTRNPNCAPARAGLDSVAAR